MDCVVALLLQKYEVPPFAVSVEQYPAQDGMTMDKWLNKGMEGILHSVLHK